MELFHVCLTVFCASRAHRETRKRNRANKLTDGRRKLTKHSAEPSSGFAIFSFDPIPLALERSSSPPRITEDPDYNTREKSQQKTQKSRLTRLDVVVSMNRA